MLGAPEAREMINFLSALFQTRRESVIPTRNTPMHPKTVEGSLQDLILGACSDKDVSRMHTLLDEWHELLFRQAAKSGSVEILQQLLDRYSTTAVLNQLMLEQAAQHGNAAVFRFLLQQQPGAVISDDVRSKALEGGVEIWKVILDHKPELINYDFGEKGDLVAMATLTNNVPLLRFFLAVGLDPNNSHLFTKPIINVASANPSIKPEILDLLLQYGATKEKSLTANKEWRKI
ncbi:MAG: hypothetical protein LQ338_007360 [Usnochroma carphineum]|nr:MAG: hypothetical protein LQ338_007360 [Usnochroma carphineum]